MIQRQLETVLNGRMHQGKVLILLGPRQVGKTTLLRSITQQSTEKHLWINCDETRSRELLSNPGINDLRLIIGDRTLVIIDEAQKVANIGQTLKLFADNFPDVQVIATGSSAFDLQNKLNEPLTGRKFEYTMLPISSEEMINDQGLIAEQSALERRLIYGSYPDILNHPQDAREMLSELCGSYLYKDVLALGSLQKPDLLNDILIALALQVGSEVSYAELSQTVKSDIKTVQRYVELLEKCFVIFRLPALNRNMRNEIKKSRKVYFYDTGIRNALIQNFNPLALRQDVGALWENFVIVERMKHNLYRRNYARLYFWRTTTQQEIDLVEEQDGAFTACEVKWNPRRKADLPDSFAKAYPGSQFKVINPDNILDWLTE